MSQDVKYLHYCLTLQAPAVVTTLSGDPNSAATQPFIPGNAVRGALAARLLAENVAADSEEFRTLILDGGVRYLHAYPAENSTRSLPAPVGWRREKGKPGESMFDLAAYSGHVDEHTTWSVEDARLRIEPEDVWPAVALDRKGIRPFAAIVGSSAIGVQPHSDARMHQQRDREAGRSWRKRENGSEIAQGTPFVYEYLEPNQSFRGIIEVIASSDGEAHALVERIKAVLTGQTVLVGRSRRAGYGGAASITFKDEQPHEALWGDVQQNDVQAGGTFRAYLLSSCIVRDPCTGQFDPCAVSNLLVGRLGGADVLDVERAACEFEFVGGFNRKWRLETPQALVVKAGSIFVLKALQVVPRARLHDVVDAGLGERRVEGFGRVVFLKGEGSRIAALRNPHDKAAGKIELDDRQPPELVRFLQQRMIDAAVNAALDRKVADIIGSRAGKTPTASLLGRLRIPLRSGQPEDGLKTLRQWLRDPDSKDRAMLKKEAQDKLHGCRLANASLHEWLRANATAEAGAKLARDETRMNRQIVAGKLVEEIAEKRGAHYAVRLIDAVLATLARKAREEGRRQPQ